MKRQKTRKAPEKNKRGKIDYLLAAVVLGISLFGLLMVYNASSVVAIKDFGDKFYYLKEQAKWLSLAVVISIVVSKVDYHKLYNWSPIMLVGVIILLIGVFIPGIGMKIYGARRWINLGFTTIQPSEITKAVMVIYLSAWFSTKEKGRLAAFLLLIGFVTALIVAEPDLGTAIIILSITIIIYFISGAPIKHFLALLPLAGIAGVLLSIVSPYRLKRVLSFLDSSSDPLGSSYHIRQVLIALGSGGLFGLGLGNSRQKYQYLPEATTDSILAIIAEEIGFVGVTLLLLAFLFLFHRGLEISKKAPDKFGQLLAAGVTSWFFVQTFTNFFSMVALIPLTGIPLPFISYGGSALLVLSVGVGILLNISRQAKEIVKV